MTVIEYHKLFLWFCGTVRCKRHCIRISFRWDLTDKTNFAGKFVLSHGRTWNIHGNSCHIFSRANIKYHTYILHADFLMICTLHLLIKYWVFDKINVTNSHYFFIRMGTVRFPGPVRKEICQLQSPLRSFNFFESLLNPWPFRFKVKFKGTKPQRASS